MSDKSKRIKAKTPAKTLRTLDEVQAAVGEIAAWTNQHRQYTAAIDAETLRLREFYAVPVACLADRIAENSAAVQAWAQANPAWFDTRKSLKLNAGTIGFRTGTPKVGKLKRWTWAAVLEALKSLKWGGAYIRIEEVINKDRIIADVRAAILEPSQLLKAGAQVVQEETFFIEPKLTELETRQVAKTEAA